MQQQKKAGRERLQDFVLPPMPDSLAAIQKEQARESPGIERITSIIAGDASLSAEVLKVVNSPAFGLPRKVASIPTAVMLLGLGNVLNVARGVALRAAVAGQCNMQIERFWDTAAEIAFACASLARELIGVPSDVAYTLGLMHDCGIPVMMCHFGDYAAHVSKAQHTFGLDWVLAERERYGIDHSRVGWMVAKQWHMPENIAMAIRYHHEFTGLLAAGPEKVGEDILSLVGVLNMAEHVSHTLRGLVFRDQSTDNDWARIGRTVLDYFGLDQVDFNDLRDDLVVQLGQR